MLPCIVATPPTNISYLNGGGVGERRWRNESHREARGINYYIQGTDYCPIDVRTYTHLLEES